MKKIKHQPRLHQNAFYKERRAQVIKQDWKGTYRRSSCSGSSFELGLLLEKFTWKTHNFPQTAHCCSSSFQPLSETNGFSSCLFKAPPPNKAQSHPVMIGQQLLAHKEMSASAAALPGFVRGRVGLAPTWAFCICALSGAVFCPFTVTLGFLTLNTFYIPKKHLYNKPDERKTGKASYVSFFFLYMCSWRWLTRDCTAYWQTMISAESRAPAIGWQRPTSCVIWGRGHSSASAQELNSYVL